ncbi:MAG: transposase [Dehalococcoidia bacterium]
MDERPLAYLITWTCYGARLHGDARGTVDVQHNQAGTAFVPPNLMREQFERSRMTQDPFMLTKPRRTVIRHAINETARASAWRVLCVNVRTNHVHVVLETVAEPARARNSLKSWCTRRMREAGLAARDAKVWAEGGSARFLWTPEAVEKASHYVMFEQGPDLD